MRDDEVTILISSSPISSHPSTEMIEKTIASVRAHFPYEQIIVMQDGVRPEQEFRRKDYEAYVTALVGKHLPKVHVAEFHEFHHQALATMRTLATFVTTPLMLFVEHDTPLAARPIDWELLKEELLSGATNHIRLHYSEEIHADHQHMMCGKLSDRLIKTVQWHQRPHLANADWYLQVLANVFNDKSRSMIEDRVYTFVAHAPWEDYRLTIYDPEGTGQNMLRSLDLNGRDGEQKYEMIF